MVTSTRMPLAEFLAVPETKPYLEYVRGEVLPKSMPNANHSALVKELLFQLESVARSGREARVDTELRHLAPDEERVYIPDVSVTRIERWPADWRNPVDTPPDLAVEVLSPDDRAGTVLDKVDFYLRLGVRLIWLVDPDARSVTVYRRGEEPHLLRAPSVLDAEPVLSDFELPLDELFALVRDVGESST